MEDAGQYATIGSLVGLSAQAVKHRVDQLQENGTMPSSGRVTRLPWARRPGAGWVGRAAAACGPGPAPAACAAACAGTRRLWGVQGCGEADALLYIQAANMGHFERLIAVQPRAKPLHNHTRSVIVVSRLMKPAVTLPFTLIRGGGRQGLTAVERLQPLAAARAAGRGRWPLAAAAGRWPGVGRWPLAAITRRRRPAWPMSVGRSNLIPDQVADW